MSLSGEDPKELYKRYEEDPEGYEANAKLGLYLSSIRKTFIHGEPYLRKALAFGKKDRYTQDILDRLGSIYTQMGYPEIAADIYRVAIRTMPEAIHFFYRLGDELFRIGQEDDASRLYETANEALYSRAKRVSQEMGEPVTHLLEPSQTFARYFGEMGHRFDLYLKVRELGLIEGERAILLAAERILVNRPFAEYWSGFADIYFGPEEISEMLERYANNWIYTDYYKLPDGRTMHRMLAHRMVQELWEKQGRAPLLTVKPEHKKAGYAFLKQKGMPDDAWFVSMHVREPGFFDEDVPWNNNRFRNARIETYFPAVEEIVKRGGWVIRMGDPSMTPLPEMDNVIDFACGEEREKWMDMFIIGESRFFLGMASGPSALPPNFGVPSLGTNWFPLGWWPFCTGDMFVPKLLRRKSDGKLLTTTETLAPPYFGAIEPLFFDRYGVEVVDNTPEELKEAVVEMLDRLDGIPMSGEDQQLHDAYQEVADPYNVGLLSRPATGMLKRYPELVK